MDLACLKRKKKKPNHKLLVTVHAPKASSATRHHQTKLQKKKKMKKAKHKLVVTVHAPKASSRHHERKKMEKKKVKSGQKQKQLKLCDFPADLVANIVGGLSSADRIRFGATCKKNLSLVTTKNPPYHYQFREIDKLPWLASFHWDAPGMKILTLEFSLFEPLHIQGQPDYATYKIKDPKGEGFGNWRSIKLTSSNKGWLLYLWSTQAQGKETGLISFLLFSPFDKRIIKLPELDHSFVDNWIYLVHCRATFSTYPSSPDCVYFFLSQMRILGKIRISTLDQTSKEWKTTVFDHLINYVSSVVYNQGCFYCVSITGELAAYDVVHRSWKVVVSYSSRLSDMVRSSDAYLVVCEGKVILVVLDKKPLENKVEMNSCGIFEYSSSTRTWVKKKSLGNNALFVGQTSLSPGQTSFAVPVMPSSSSDNIADRVYFYSRSSSNNPFYYSLKDGRCHQCKDNSSYWSSDVKDGMWIEPPCHNSTPYSSDDF